MKIHCRTCGCHFDDDFEETLSPECKLWEHRGFHSDMSVEHKRALWDAYFSVPVDEIADETGVITQIDLRATPGMTYSVNEFEAYVPGYRHMTDRQKRDFQKKLFRFIYTQHPRDLMRNRLEAMGVWDDLVQAEREAQLTPEERRDLEAERRGDFRHCDPDVDYEELDRIRDQEEEG